MGAEHAVARSERSSSSLITPVPAKNPKPGRVAKVLSIIGLLLLAASYWADRPILHLMGQELWLVDVAPVVLVMPFGLWRLRIEKDGYQRIRLITILGLYF